MNSQNTENKLMVASGNTLVKWITNKDLLYSTWTSAQCYVPAWIGEGFGGRMDTYG